jgi:beta-mannosidase
MPWEAAMRVRRIDFTTGEKRYGGYGESVIEPRSVGGFRLYGEPFGNPRDPQRECIVCEIDDLRALWFFAPDKELHYPPPAFDADWLDGKLTIRAKSLMRDVCVFADRLDPESQVSDQMVTILPGESFTFEIRSEKKLTKDQLTSPPVLRCANPFGSSLTSE